MPVNLVQVAKKKLQLALHGPNLPTWDLQIYDRPSGTDNIFWVMFNIVKIVLK